MKPALRSWFIFDFYAREHDRLPGHGIEGRKRLRKKRRAVIERWWRLLPPARRNAFIAEAERMVARYNDGLAQARYQIQQWIDEIQGHIVQYKTTRRYSSRG